MTSPRDYENGVADVLAFLGGDGTTVERNVYLPGHRSKVLRQIDIVVRGRFGEMADTMLVVDCKRHARPVDVKIVEAFVGAMEDVGADIGMIVASTGMTTTARQRVAERGGVKLEVISVDELKAWRPPGTFTTAYRISTSGRAAAEKLLNKAGYRVTDSTTYPRLDTQEVIDVLRHYGGRQPSVEDQNQQIEQVAELLRQAGDSEPALVAHGITVQGGDPTQKWLEVALDGRPVGLKVIAGNYTEADEQLDAVASSTGYPRRLLTVIAPDGWPVTGIFG